MTWGRAEALDDISGRIAIVGIGESQHSSASGRTSLDIAGDAVERAVADAGLQAADVDGLMWMGHMDGQLDAAAFHARFGTDHELWTSPVGGGMRCGALMIVQDQPCLSPHTVMYRHVPLLCSEIWSRRKAETLNTIHECRPSLTPFR